MDKGDLLLCLFRIVQFKDINLERLSMLAHLAKRDCPRFVELGVYAVQSARLWII